MGRLGNSSCLVVTDMRVKCRHKHETLVQQFFDLATVRLDTGDAVHVKALARVSEKAD